MVGNLSAQLQQPSDHSHRPIGIWLITLANTVLVAMALRRLIPVLLDPDGGPWAPSTVAWAPFVVATLFGISVSLFGTWAGLRLARTIFLSLLTAYVALALYDYAHLVRYWLSDTFENRWTETNWWEISSGLRLALWLGVNYWYLLGRRTKSHFSSAGRYGHN